MNENKLKHRKKLKHYNMPYHAHELTFSCYHRNDYFKNPAACNIFIEKLGYIKDKFNFKLWAYVLMPNHVHLLILTAKESYNISMTLQNIKGSASTLYRQWMIENCPVKIDGFCVNAKGRKVFRCWQPRGGFDINLWSVKAIHCSINYIEGNPVRAGLAETPEEWLWLSAWARLMKPGLVSDFNDVPVLMK
jgi:putative transposase